MGTEMTDETEKERRADVLTVDPRDEGTRLDQYLNDALDWNSRARIQEAIKLGTIRVNEERAKPSYRVRTGDVIGVAAAPPPPDDYLLPEDIPLTVLHEDASLLVIDKAPFIAVHPGAGHRTGTLANAFAHHFAQLSTVGGPLRPGIVHRLDRDTTGVLCVAKTDRAHFSITGQFHDREVEKTYLAIAEGVMEFDEYAVDRPIARHPNNPIKMACVDDGRPSETRFEVIERFRNYTFVRCHPRTGRTHQIRLHLESLGHPIVCDRLYGRRTRIRLGEITALSPDDPADRTLMERQALHAAALVITHPLTGRRVRFEAPLAADMQALVDALRRHQAKEPNSSPRHRGDRS